MVKIALTNLGKYNEGVLDFVWLELPATEDEISEAYDKIEVCHDGVEYTDEFGSPYEEVFISDYESDIDGIKIGEYDNIDELNEMAEKVEDFDNTDKIIFGALMEEGYDFDEAVDKVSDCIYYSGCYNMKDVAEQLIDELGGIEEAVGSDRIDYYFDYDSFGNDLKYDGDWVFYEGDCYWLPESHDNSSDYESEDDLSDWQQDIFDAFKEKGYYDEEEILGFIDDVMVFNGCFDMGDAAEAYVNEVYGEPTEDLCKEYFDFEAYGRDLEIEETFVQVDDGYVWIR